MGVVARRQNWIVSRTQCAEAGLPDFAVDRLVDRGFWQKVAPGVYATHNGPLSWLSLAEAAVVSARCDALLCDAAAGHLWGLSWSQPVPITLLVPHAHHPVPTSRWTYRRTRHWPTDAVGSIPRTPLAHTVVDLCERHPERAQAFIVEALHSGRTSVPEILAVVDGRPRVRHRKLIEAMLGRAERGVNSELEHRYERDVERAHGLPRGQRQVVMGSSLLDVRYDRLVVELDGRLGHAGAGQFRDMARDNRHLVSGLVTLRFGWDDVVGRPCQVAAQVTQVMAQFGMRVQLHPCKRCR